ncbi:MAG: efflux RND transporter permease subunit, partial [Planctomycetes bacterium]|nr:efflux RND transporter permease subunit [Planctomycetota bacterium]
VLRLSLSGNRSEKNLRELAEAFREDLLTSPTITQVELEGVRDLEISINVSQEMLRRYNTTLGDIASKVKAAAVELPGGGVKTPSGEVLVRMDERRDYAREFEDIPIISSNDGTEVKLSDMAEIIDGFEDTDEAAKYNEKPSVVINIMRIGDETPIGVATAAKEIMDKWNEKLPEGLSINILHDWSEIYRQRIDLLLRNAAMGLTLVMITLGLFLEIRLAFWVMMGIPISFLGSLLLLPALGVSINMISLFAFITALGIVVDDAIVIGENIFEMRQKGLSFSDAGIEGAKQVSVPVVFSVLTNIAAFAPLLFLPGMTGKVFGVIPIVVISIFSISLVEALLILPAHLAHQRKKGKDEAPGTIEKVRFWFSEAMRHFIQNRYAPFFRKALHHRYLTMAVGLGVLALTYGLFAGGHIKIIGFPNVSSDTVRASAALPFGSPIKDTRALTERLEKAAKEVARKYERPEIITGIYSRIGHDGSHNADVRVYLVPEDERKTTSDDFADYWRKEIGEVPGLESLTFKSFAGPRGGEPVDVELSHPDMEVLETASADLAERLNKYALVSDIDDGFAPGKPQLNFKVKPEAESLGLTASTIGRQVRNAFYGAEALRQQRGRNEVKVKVRLPKSERVSEHNIETLIIRSPQGVEIPLFEAATPMRDRAYTNINRKDGRRVVNVTADVTPRNAAEDIREDVFANDLPIIMEKYPGLICKMSGEQEDIEESNKSLTGGFIFALLVIYAMLAIPFNSYFQPLIIMVSIPFGIVGAVLGHLLMGYDISTISMAGILALSGVVVNDSLVLIDYANQCRNAGDTPFESVFQAGVRRFRPIILTSFTTFGGLAPMIFETSVQAKFLIPMAISLGYGILFATLIALLLVPALYLILDDIGNLWKRYLSS